MPRISRREFLALTQLGAICLAITILGACGNGGSSAPSENAGPCAPLPPAADSDFLVRLTPFMNNLCYQRQNWQHDAQVRTSDGVHPFVRVWYSPSLFDWITVKNRVGPVPDGAIVVKEQFHDLSGPLFEWTVMVKDSESVVGWMVLGRSFESHTAESERYSDAVARRRMCRAASPVQRRGIVLPELPRIGDRQFGNLFEHRVPESAERWSGWGARGCVGDDRRHA